MRTPDRNLGFDVNACLSHFPQPPLKTFDDRDLRANPLQNQLPRAVEKPIRRGVDDRAPRPLLRCVQLFRRLRPALAGQTDDVEISAASPWHGARTYHVLRKGVRRRFRRLSHTKRMIGSTRRHVDPGGSHIALTEGVLKLLRAAGLERVPVIVRGIIPPADAERLKAAGVAAVYTPKNFEINDILGEIVKEVEARHDAELTVQR